jgi:cysteine desulfurase/selenocysteine lyase
LSRLAAVRGLTLHGPLDPSARGALISFTLAGAHPHDIGEILGRRGVCVRAGHHCAQPLMRRLGVGATTRASFAVHNSTEDVDRLIEGLEVVRQVLEL